MDLQLHVKKLSRNERGEIPPHHRFRVPAGAVLRGAYAEVEESKLAEVGGRPPRQVATVCLIYDSIGEHAPLEVRDVALVAHSPRGQAVSVDRLMHWRAWFFMPDGSPVGVYESDPRPAGAAPAPTPLRSSSSSPAAE